MQVIRIELFSDDAIEVHLEGELLTSVDEKAEHTGEADCDFCVVGDVASDVKHDLSGFLL